MNSINLKYLWWYYLQLNGYWYHRNYFWEFSFTTWRYSQTSLHLLRFRQSNFCSCRLFHRYHNSTILKIIYGVLFILWVAPCPTFYGLSFFFHSSYQSINIKIFASILFIISQDKSTLFLMCSFHVIFSFVSFKQTQHLQIQLS